MEPSKGSLLKGALQRTLYDSALTGSLKRSLEGCKVRAEGLRGLGV